MFVKFSTPVSFSDGFFEKKTNEGKNTSLEKLVQLIDSCCSVLQKTGIEVKSVSKDRVLIYDRTLLKSSCLEKSIKILMCLLIVPMIILLALKLILRFALSIKYSGFLLDQEVEPVKPVIRKPEPTPVKKVEKKHIKLTDREIEKTYLTLRFSRKEEKDIEKITETIFSLGATITSLEGQGIHVSSDPSLKNDLVFTCEQFPNITFKYYHGRLASQFGTLIEKSSGRIARKSLDKIWSVGVRVLRPILDAQGTITSKERDKIFIENSALYVPPAVACVVDISLSYEVIGLLAIETSKRQEE
ncbi:hypothetical protein [Chlamydia sp. 17-3921]|uniref:hypothetical protein n=1 Tax=Chlamydia sp. 17-3921 TaxID=2675798 RepID=UPI00191ADF26|nr:hypothetical protein [Chlamydia sp. 17-3921]